MGIRGAMSWLGRRGLGEGRGLLLWAALVGFGGALATVAFRVAVDGVQFLLLHRTGRPEVVARSLPVWARLAAPAAGGLLAGLILQYGMRLAPRRRSTDYMEAVALGDGVVGVRASLVKSASSTTTIASGGSIGREGAMVQLAAVIGSIVGRALHMPAPPRRLLVACGAAAGIASAYNAPIGAAVFASEILLQSIALESMGPLIVASVVANATVHQFLGFAPEFRVPAFRLVSTWGLVCHGLLGALAGLLAPAFLTLLERSEALFERTPLSVSSRLAVGGVIVGVASVFVPEVWGNGYSVVSEILRAHWTWRPLLALLVLKMVATAATVGSGAVGGVFTPTLLVGATLGALWGSVVHGLLPDLTAAPEAFAVVGMGAFLAGTTHATLTSILMVFEMTLDYDMILPLMLASMVAHYVARTYRGGESIYADSLRRKQADHPSPVALGLGIEALLRPPLTTVTPDTPAAALAKAFAGTRYRYFYVVDLDMRLVGVVSRERVAEADPDDLAAELVIDEWPVLTTSMWIEQALHVMAHMRAERLPLVDDPEGRQLLGTLSRADLLLALQEQLSQIEAHA